MKRLFFFAALSVCVGSMLVSCMSNANSEMKKILKGIDEKCPIPFGSFGEFTSATLDGDNAVFTLSCSEEAMNLDSLQQHEDLVKTGIIQSFATLNDENVQLLMDELVKADMGITYRFIGKTTGGKLEVNVSADEIKKLKQSSAGSGDPDKLLETNIQMSNVQCPMSMGNGLVMNKVVREGDNVVYVYEVDENLISIDLLKSKEKELVAGLREEVKNSVNDAAMTTFLKLCRAAHVGLGYRYVGATSGKTVTFFIPANEI